jgi:hypothetical protein
LNQFILLNLVIIIWRSVIVNDLGFVCAKIDFQRIYNIDFWEILLFYLLPMSFYDQVQIVRVYMFVLYQNLLYDSFLLKIKTVNGLLYCLNVLLIMQILRWLASPLDAKTHLLIYWYLLKLKLIVVTYNEITIVGTNLLSELPCVVMVVLVAWLMDIIIFVCWDLLLI